jgi:hypothetical protein
VTQGWWDWMAVGAYVLEPRTVLGRAWRLLTTTIVAILLLPLAGMQDWLRVALGMLRRAGRALRKSWRDFS